MVGGGGSGKSGDALYVGRDFGGRGIVGAGVHGGDWGLQGVHRGSLRILRPEAIMQML